MQHLPSLTWLHMFQGADPRRTIPVSYYYCDERLRLAQITLPKSRETEPESGGFEKVLYVLSGILSVAITGTGKGLIGRPGDMIFVPPHTEHTLQAIEGGPVTCLSTWAYA
jgi:quercetin dioxygenase-like cupin family protein